MQMYAHENISQAYIIDHQGDEVLFMYSTCKGVQVFLYVHSIFFSVSPTPVSPHPPPILNDCSLMHSFMDQCLYVSVPWIRDSRHKEWLQTLL